MSADGKGPLLAVACMGLVWKSLVMSTPGARGAQEGPVLPQVRLEDWASATEQL